MRVFQVLLFRCYRNCAVDGAFKYGRTNVYNNCLPETPLKSLKFNLAQSFIRYHSELNNSTENQTAQNEDGSYKKDKFPGADFKKRKNLKVSVINERNDELIMTLMDAENYARRKNMRLIPVDDNRKAKLKYKLVSDIFEDKKQRNKNTKKLIFREEIAAHDLEIKMNHMLTLLHKGNKLVCLIEGAGGAKMNAVISELEKSQLNEFFIQKIKKSRGIQIIYQGVASNKGEKTELKNEESSQ